MGLRRVLASLFYLSAIPVCGSVAVGAVMAGDHLFGETVPSSSGKRGLVIALMGVWGVVLFGFLLKQAEWLADTIAGAEEPACPAPSKSGCESGAPNGREIRPFVAGRPVSP
jgi:hypothetical protein